MVALPRHSADLLDVLGPSWSARLKDSVATSSGQLSNDSRPLHKRQRLSTEKRALEGSRRPSVCTAVLMRTARIARNDVNVEAPLRGLGSFSRKRNILLEECLLRAPISVISKDHQPSTSCEAGGHCELATSLPVGRLFYRKAMAVGQAGVWKKQFWLRKVWLTFVTFCGYWR